MMGGGGTMLTVAADETGGESGMTVTVTSLRAGVKVTSVEGGCRCVVSDIKGWWLRWRVEHDNVTHCRSS